MRDESHSVLMERIRILGYHAQTQFKKKQVRFDLGVNPTRLCERNVGGEVRAVSLSPDTCYVVALVIEKSSSCVRLCVVSTTKSNDKMKSIVLEENYVESKQEHGWHLRFFPDGKSVLLLIPGCKNAQIYKVL